jgi:Polyketide cyclase / dehydrase and lipid transport
MARVRGSIDIDRPVDEVFDVVADQTNEPRYNPAMTASHRLDDGPIGVGTRFRATVLIQGKPQQVEIEITGFERPSEMASRSVMGAQHRHRTTAVRPCHIRDETQLGLGCRGRRRRPGP